MTKCEMEKAVIQTGLDLSLNINKALNDSILYRQLNDPLLHLSNTVWPDISFEIGYLSRLAHCPTEQLCREAKHALRYFNGNADRGDVLRVEEDSALQAFAEADWGQEKNN